MIIDPATVPAFVTAVLLILIAPGPDMMFMIGTGLSAGHRGAVVAAFGVTAGVTIYVLGSAVGLAALIERTPGILEIVRLAGAAYLLYLAVTMWRAAKAQTGLGEGGSGDLSEIFRRGFIVNITNPKVVLFIAAFIPQFVDTTAGNTTGQFLVYALTFQLLGLIVDLAVGVGAGTTRRFLAIRPNTGLVLDRVAASVYLAIAAWLTVDFLA